MYRIKPTIVNDTQYDFLLPDEVNDSCYNIIFSDWEIYHGAISRCTYGRRNVIQAGGNAGLYPFFYSLEYEHVFTFEPEPKNFHCLSYNCQKSNITKMNMALSDRCEFNKIGFPGDVYNYGMAKLGIGETPVYTITIDSLNIKDVSLIHLDIEGYEYQALLGALNTIEESRPTVVVEASMNEDKILKLMEDHEYTTAAKFGGINDSPYNYVFTPNERTLKGRNK